MAKREVAMKRAPMRAGEAFRPQAEELLAELKQEFTNAQRGGKVES